MGSPKYERMQEALDSSALGTPTFTVGAEASNIINVAVQMVNIDGQDMDERCCVGWYLSSDVNGDALATVPSVGISIGTDGLLIETITNSAGWVTCESDGDIDVNIEDSGTPTMHRVIVLPNGKLAVSAAITFA